MHPTITAVGRPSQWVALLVVAGSLLSTPARVEATSNPICQDCHAVPDLRFTDRVTGESILYSIEPDAYRDSVHGQVDCVACHERGYGDTLPHEGPATTPRFLCVDCHEALGDLEHLDLPARREELLQGAHGDEGLRRLDCHDCHDPHRFALVRREKQALPRIAASNRICLACHGLLEDRLFGYATLHDAARTHDHFPNPVRHFARVKCVTCHAPLGAGAAHDVRPAAESLGDCSECHVRADPAYAASYATAEGAGDLLDQVYVIGSSRSAILDRGSQIGFVLFLLLVLGHSLRRRQSGRVGRRARWLRVKGPPAIRLWHGLQVVLAFGLLGSGLSMHYGDSGLAPLPFRAAVRTHNALGVANVALWLAFVVGNARSGRVRAYLGRLRSLPRELPAQAHYYAGGIFRGESEPRLGHPDERFNPIQKLSYAVLMYVVLPTAVLAGSVLFYPLIAPERALGHPGLWPVAMVHLAAGYSITLFVVVHVYMVGSSGRAEESEGPG